MGLTPVSAGEVATVVTMLEMRDRPRPRPLPPSPLRLARWRSPGLDAYRTLFRRVGGPWLWYSRLIMPDERLAAILALESVETTAVVDPSGIEVGMLELDFAEPGRCEIAYFGLVPELAGRGHGRWLMAHALASAWRPGIARVTVHTCTLDHPRALGFYRAQGFVAVERRMESFADPRLTGVLPPEAAPHVPLIDPASPVRGRA